GVSVGASSGGGGFTEAETTTAELGTCSAADANDSGSAPSSRASLARPSWLPSAFITLRGAFPWCPRFRLRCLPIAQRRLKHNTSKREIRGSTPAFSPFEWHERDPFYIGSSPSCSATAIVSCRNAGSNGVFSTGR